MANRIGELEVLTYIYWTMETVDLLTYNQRVERTAQKQLLFHIFADVYRSDLKGPDHVSAGLYHEKFCRLLQKHGKFLSQKNHVSAKSVAFVMSTILMILLII
ncbi:unnamed protein product [Macrosiphum euphorbiae]|uniref:Uncharacterized protein n=1 Tax=Macrosiphum euphorbiae TaxID=13131 RepID=A0AAV0Y4T1_9HEMI|nr:unnamed protein product [Macrosiphum euphorbiae]